MGWTGRAPAPEGNHGARAACHEKEHHHASHRHRSRSDRHRNRYGQEHASHGRPRYARHHCVAREGLTRTHYIEACGTCVYLIMPTSNTTCFQRFLNVLSRRFARQDILLILDGAPNHPSQRFSFGLSSGRFAISHFPTISRCSSCRPMRFEGVILKDFLADFIAHLYRWRCLVFFALRKNLRSAKSPDVELEDATQPSGAAADRPMASRRLLSHGTCHILLTQSLLLPSGWSPPDLPRRSSGWIQHMIPFDPRRRQAAVQEDSQLG